jgi:CPA2 family monovalent cation:H+ antiporter-2
VLPMTVDLNRLAGHVVVVGYGRVGRRIGTALTANGISIVVVEDNREIVEQLRKNDVVAVFGNAGEPTVLVQAHIQRARMLVIALPDTANVRGMVGTARAVNPDIETVVRTHRDDDLTSFERDIAGKVFLGEHELAVAMIRYVLERYGTFTGQS